MLEVIVKRKYPETPNIMSFEFERINGEPLPPYEAGSHIDVKIKDGLIRQYSLISGSQSDHLYHIAVLKDPSSTGGSESMHNDIVEGQTLFISEPRNLFPLDMSSQRVLLFAGGIGITPIMSMAMTLHQQQIDFQLHYYCRSKSDAAFYNQLASSEFGRSVVFHINEKEKAIEKIIGSFDSTCHVYTCGPVGFMDYVFACAKGNGWNEANLHRENFKAIPPTGDVQNLPFKLVLSRSGLEIDVEPDASVLDALEDAGIEIDVSCEMGVCGTCVTNVLDGEPDHRDSFLSDAEKANNNVFTPCCSRAKSDTLVIDL